MEPLLGSTPLTAGDLRTTPFAHVLVELLETEESGTLFIHGEDQVLEAAVRIEGGFPTALRFEVPVDDAKTSGSNLLHALIPLCSRASGAFRFVAGQHIEMNVPASARSRVDPLTLIMAASRGPLREDAVEQVMLTVAQPREAEPARQHRSLRAHRARTLDRRLPRAGADRSRTVA